MAPDWLAGVAEPDWFRHYATRAEDSRFPKARAKRDEVGLRIGRDGTRLLEAVFAPTAPHGLLALDEVEVLRQIWVGPVAGPATCYPVRGWTDH